jgi:hypothetical protein
MGKKVRDDLAEGLGEKAFVDFADSLVYIFLGCRNTA